MNFLLEHFDTLSEAPGGVQKLRDLILQLAVMGKLVLQDPRDEPASVLFKKIKKERKRLIEEGKIRIMKPLLEISLETKQRELPAGWIWVRLGEVILNIWGGGTPSKSNPEFWNGNVPWASVKDLNKKYLDSTIDQISDKGVINSSTNVIPEEHIIICTRMGLGKIAINKIRVAINQDLKAICLSSFINKDYFYNLYKTLNLKGTGMTVKGIKQVELLNLIIPLPPLDEQRRIVNRIEDLMTLCNQYEKNLANREDKWILLNYAVLKKMLDSKSEGEFRDYWQIVSQQFEQLYRKPENVSQLRNTILQLAVMGKLVPQDPKDESASILLEKIKKEKDWLYREGKIKKTNPLPEITEEKKPYDLPKGWEWVRLKAISRTIEYGTSCKSLPGFKGVPILRMSNIQNGKIFLDKIKYVPHEIKDLPRLYLQKYDLLFNRTNSFELVGKAGIFTGRNDKYTFASYLIRIAFLLKFVDPFFINTAINSAYYRKTQIEPEITQQCGQANFNGTKLSNTLIPIAPIAEQRRIVAKVEELLDLCDRLEEKLKQGERLGDEMFSALIKQLQI